MIPKTGGSFKFCSGMSFLGAFESHMASWLVVAMINLHTMFEMSSFTHSKDMKDIQIKKVT